MTAQQLIQAAREANQALLVTLSILVSAATFLHLFMTETDSIRSLARDHAGYRWARRPNHAWTPEQRAAYDQEYETARGEPANTSYFILVTPSRMLVKKTPYFHTVSGQTYEIAERLCRELEQREACKDNSLLRSTFQIFDYNGAKEAAQKLGISFS